MYVCMEAFISSINMVWSISYTKLSILLEIRDRSFITSQGGAVVSEKSGKIKFLPLHNNPK